MPDWLIALICIAGSMAVVWIAVKWGNRL